MDLSKLSANEKLAVYGSVALVVLGIVSNWGGLMWVSVLAGIAALVVIFLPQMSPATTLPGTKGTLLVSLGGIAAAGAVIELLRFLNYFFNTLDFWQTWAFALALVGALVLGWAGWKIFQAEGGKFQFGTARGTSASAAAATPAPPPASGPMSPPASEPMSPPASEPMSPPPPAPAEPMGSTQDDDRA